MVWIQDDGSRDNPGLMLTSTSLDTGSHCFHDVDSPFSDHDPGWGWLASECGQGTVAVWPKAWSGSPVGQKTSSEVSGTWNEKGQLGSLCVGGTSLLPTAEHGAWEGMASGEF